MLLAFSFSVWSQAVIAEVYSLHILLIALYTLALHAWIRDPQSIGETACSSSFLLTLSFVNHQLTIILVPLPFLAALLVRRATAAGHDRRRASPPALIGVRAHLRWLSGSQALIRTATTTGVLCRRGAGGCLASDSQGTNSLACDAAHARGGVCWDCFRWRTCRWPRRQTRR